MASHAGPEQFKRTVSPLAVLAQLCKKPMYGYELSQQINECAQEKLVAEVLYPTLYRLEQQGLICVTDTTVENGRARHYYSITVEGEAYLSRTVAEYRELSALYLDALREVEY